MFSVLVAAGQAVLTVFAAASLHGAFDELGKQFAAAHPGVSVRFNYDGSQVLELQLAQGATADVFASADQRWMDAAKREKLVTIMTPFATNSLAIITAPGSSVHAAADLAHAGTKVLLCADAVPCGRYARELLVKMDDEPAFGSGFSAAVLRNVVSDEQNVEEVFAKIVLGAADCGIVYRSDVASRADAASSGVRVINLPPESQPSIVYPIAPVSGSSSSELAAAFVKFVQSASGQTVLRRFGFGAAP
ncbi:MAG: molybdate ABC transporter substrate-binding protein [Candidatus Eremiobacteraeota bacterium]|nr:molybdate ABC transporter substrate-binding protein [Candidatus Eremiobacteraeota bacterium]